MEGFTLLEAFLDRERRPFFVLVTRIPHTLISSPFQSKDNIAHIDGFLKNGRAPKTLRKTSPVGIDGEREEFSRLSTGRDSGICGTTQFVVDGAEEEPDFPKPDLPSFNSWIRRCQIKRIESQKSRKLTSGTISVTFKRVSSYWTTKTKLAKRDSSQQEIGSTFVRKKKVLLLELRKDVDERKGKGEDQGGKAVWTGKSNVLFRRIMVELERGYQGGSYLPSDLSPNHMILILIKGRSSARDPDVHPEAFALESAPLTLLTDTREGRRPFQTKLDGRRHIRVSMSKPYATSSVDIGLIKSVQPRPPNAPPLRVDPAVRRTFVDLRGRGCHRKAGQVPSASRYHEAAEPFWKPVAHIAPNCD
ncbi:uncharacterized protein EI90DRAFT_3014879 [Cantharellus anzutake]|uniref:uncharacterized protein n=1 Tax=Cantharellus anzutake TaxID=1750568 RepID=UPI00190586BF|nr:uncharacterized protein EI90DRAFT_3014879 [Cantharellus anzutake]KAF8334597.1 hypothetical protein EI90DRAFT_3014879 [Cantharellus anzutake]